MSNPEGYTQCCDPGVTWEGTTSGKLMISALRCPRSSLMLLRYRHTHGRKKSNCLRMDGKLGPLSAYFAEPKSTPKAGIMLIHDIHGWDKKNIRLVADKFADAGFVAVVPDFYKGQSAPSDMSKIMNFLGGFPVEKSFEEVQAALAEFKSKYSLSKVGAQGFCWGGKYTVLALGSGDIDAGVVAHGSLLNEGDVEAIKKPVLFLYSANDRMIPDDVREKYQAILKTKSFPAEGVYYPDQAHGWTLRGDDKDPKVGDAAKDAFARALKWFQAHL